MVSFNYAFASLVIISDLILYVPRLNGTEVDGQQLVAKPAPIYPPDVLKVLWSQPEGRKHLKTTFNSMLLKVGGSTVGLTELVDKFYADVQET